MKKYIITSQIIFMLILIVANLSGNVLFIFGTLLLAVLNIFISVFKISKTI